MKQERCPELSRQLQKREEEYPLDAIRGNNRRTVCQILDIDIIAARKSHTGSEDRNPTLW